MIVRQPNTQYVLSLSYGKDSLATLEAIRLLGYPLDRIIHAEIWATDTVQADLPPMVEFKAHADRIIKERYGIEVEHLCAMKDGEKLTYEKMFYHKPVRRASRERERESTQSEVIRSDDACGAWENSNYLPYKGFPLTRAAWCKKLKTQETIWKYLRFPDLHWGGGTTARNSNFFQQAPIIGCGHKYGDVSRHSGRRVYSYRAA